MILKTAKENLRPTIPNKCPVLFAKLIQQCWNQDPDLRPTASVVLKVCLFVQNAGRERRDVCVCVLLVCFGCCGRQGGGHTHRERQQGGGVRHENTRVTRFRRCTSSNRNSKKKETSGSNYKHRNQPRCPNSHTHTHTG